MEVLDAAENAEMSHPGTYTHEQMDDLYDYHASFETKLDGGSVVNKKGIQRYKPGIRGFASRNANAIFCLTGWIVSLFVLAVN